MMDEGWWAFVEVLRRMKGGVSVAEIFSISASQLHSFS
jgi:hypothetical protein